MRRTSLAALVVALTWATAPATPARATNIDSNLAASPATQANGGGCYPVSIAPGLLDMLVLINPEWSAVDPAPFLPPDSEPVTIHGSVALAKVNEAGDFPGDHVTDDQNTLVNVESPDGFVELRAFGRRWKQRTWAIEGCNGVGKHLAQRLFARRISLGQRLLTG